MLPAWQQFLEKSGLTEDSGEDVYGGIVERQVRRVSEALSLPDRRATLHDLLDTLTGNGRAQMAFGSVDGFPALLQVVREREDLESLQIALECLAAAVGGGGGDAHAGQVRCCCSASGLSHCWAAAMLLRGVP